jgi:hypothetical protein
MPAYDMDGGDGDDEHNKDDEDNGESSNQPEQMAEQQVEQPQPHLGPGSQYLTPKAKKGKEKTTKRCGPLPRPDQVSP